MVEFPILFSLSFRDPVFVLNCTSVVTTIDVPAPPEDLRYLEKTATSVVIAWGPPLNDGGSPIIDEIIEVGAKTK